MDKTYTYRAANSTDAEALMNLAIASYGGLANNLSTENLQKLLTNLSRQELWQELIHKAFSRVCVQGEQLSGMAFMVPSGNPWDIFKEEWAYIRMVGVHPDHQGKGIARKLTEMCISEARQNNEKTIALHTSEMMAPARHIYESLGFRVLEEIPPRFGKRYWLYTLDL